MNRKGMTMAKNVAGKETSERVASAAGRLFALKGGAFVWRKKKRSKGIGYTLNLDVTRDIRAVLGSALVQKLPGSKGQGRKGRRKR